MSIYLDTHTQYVYRSPLSQKNNLKDQQESPENISDNTKNDVTLSEVAAYQIPDIGLDNRGKSVYFFNSENIIIKQQGIVDSSTRSDWDAVSQEKPESFSHVPDKLWNAMVESYDEGETMGYASLFDIPKWEVGFDREPPVLNQYEVDDEKMLSYDYLSVIDEIIQHSGAILPDDTSPESVQQALDRARDHVALLTRLRENIGEVLEYPLQSNSEASSDLLAFDFIYSDAGDGMLEEQFIAYSAKYELALRRNTINNAVEQHGIPEDYRLQLIEELDNSEALDTASEQFTNYLLKTNSNLYSDLEVSPEISKEWYTTFLAEHIATVIDEMGPINEPGGKWKVPILWELEQQNATQTNHTKEAS